MKAIVAAVAVFAGLLLASLWSAPRHLPGGPGLVVQRADKPCPANSVLAGAHCVCPEATSWTGAECMQVWSNSERGVVKLAPPAPRLAVSGSPQQGNGKKAEMY
ncbi:hypothetical protein HF313_07700 [Massilia atriviolacea]|uniref:Uncharacterized protein n=1 Tax=Massilia atriviolacea TaxID=2495579 RepID=A0A430HMC3_9BURK|nr:hypothetical protein [Massilia atriviolacea]RSZ58624.1 hypothetical protein EJB06_13415 [Massilia atriviolacea]